MLIKRRRQVVLLLNLLFVVLSTGGVGMGAWFLMDPTWAWPAEMNQALPQKLLMLAGVWLALHLCITLAWWRGWRGAAPLMIAGSLIALLAWPLGTVTGVLTLGLLVWPADDTHGSAEQDPVAHQSRT